MNYLNNDIHKRMIKQKVSSSTWVPFLYIRMIAVILISYFYYAICSSTLPALISQLTYMLIISLALSCR